QQNKETPEELFEKGCDFYFGRNGKAINYNEAFKWFKRSAEQENAFAQYYLGICYEYDRGVEGNLSESFKWYKKSAEQGHAIAQYKLGGCYKNGQAVEKNQNEAFKWYKKSAEQGHATAQYNLGVFYHKGYCIPQNYNRAIEWYRKAIAGGYTNAQNNLDVCLKDKLKAENKETPEKLFNKGCDFYFGRNGKAINYNEAFKLCKLSAEQGCAEALNMLGVCYVNGKAIAKNLDEAFKWYKKSAELGYSVAQNNLADCYVRGQGTVKNEDEAFKWYEKSAAQGYFMAQYNLGVCYHNGQGVPQDYNKAIEWYKKAIAGGYTDAQNNLNICLEKVKETEIVNTGNRNYHTITIKRRKQYIGAVTSFKVIANNQVVSEKLWISQICSTSVNTDRVVVDICCNAMLSKFLKKRVVIKFIDGYNPVIEFFFKAGAIVNSLEVIVANAIIESETSQF
ncbi:MAG: tetratricopeptide repeat protein, partial [Clostridia bacterium]